VVRKHKWLVSVGLFLLCLSLFGQPLRVAFVFVNPVTDMGWSFLQDQGRRFLETTFGPAVQTAFMQNVPENSDSALVFQGFAQNGFDLIFGTSFGYMESMAKVAQAYPQTIFMHCSGYKTAPNMGTYFGRMYQPRYLSGILAGKMTTSNIIGYVAAFPLPEVVRGINAFALGVLSVNEHAEIHVVWSGTWFDPGQEREAALALLDRGADVITQHQNSPACQQAAQDRGAFSIGYNSDMRTFAPDAFLGAPVWNWGPYFVRVVQSVLDGTWTSEAYWGGMKDGIVDLLLSDRVPSQVSAFVLDAREKILQGTLEPFEGPVWDQQGNLRIPAGEIPSDEELLRMDWLVRNVVGTPH